MKRLFLILFILFALNNLYAQENTSPYIGWKQTETVHFEIIYEEISVDSVIEILNFCEDVYKSVTTFFDSYPEKITIVVHDRIDSANGSYHPAPPHINMYVSRPSTPEHGAEVDNWLRFLLIHELTHFVNMTIEKGLFYQLSRVLGESISSIPGGLMPGWAIEGIAVKLESDFTDGGRGNNPFFEMYSKALIMENKLFSWRQAAYSSYHPPNSRIYVAGYILNDYLAREYGNDVFVRIYKDYLNFPLIGFNYYVKKITGDSISKIFENMELELKEKHSNINSIPNKLFSPDIESNYYLPENSKAGWIVYRDSEDKEPALILMDPASRKETILVKTRLSDYTSFSVSADGNLVFFTSFDIDGNHPAGLRVISNLYLFERTNGKIKKITNNGHIKQPAISPNGERLIAVQKADQNTRLVEIDIETGDIKILFEQAGSSVFNPDFSSDGKQIVFTLQDFTGSNIFILDTENSINNLGQNIPGNMYNPLFTDNGNIIFVGDLEGTLSLFEIDMAEKGKLHKILTDPVGIYSGFIYNNNIIYSTYSHRGFTLRTAPYKQDLEFEKNYLFQKVENEYEKVQPLSNLENSSKYIDIPKLVAFTPIPFHINPIYESTQIFGPGITGYFRSILGKSEIFTTISLDTSMVQPGGSIDFMYNWGPVVLNYNLLQGYSESSLLENASQTTLQQILLNFPLLSRSSLGKSTYLGIFSGIQSSFSIISNKDFPFFSPISDSYVEYSNKTYHINGISYLFTGQKSHGDTIPPFLISSSTFLYTPVSNNYLKQYAFKNTNTINLPSLFNHQVFKFSERLTYSQIDNLQYLNNPRGFYISGNNNINLLTSAEYLFTIARPDWPILGGLSLQGISGSIHVEKLITLENTDIIVDKDYYSGIELILLGNYIYAFESAGIGVGYRFEQDSSSFNPKNLGIYIFIGTNSFE